MTSANGISFVGFGALAFELARGASGAGVTELRAFSRPRADPAAAAALRERMESAGVRPCASIDEAVRSADVVIAAVPAAAAHDVAAHCARAISPGALYVDPAPLLPEAKAEQDAILAGAGAQYVDAAILGTVATDGAQVPMLVAGAGAQRWAELGSTLGFRVSLVAGPPGRASLVKLLRSVFMKGRDALILEMLLAARRYGVEDSIIDSMPPGEPFDQLARRVICSLALYAERRADELAASEEVLTEAQVEPLVTRGSYERLRRLADLGLRDRLHGERPEEIEQVLALVEELSPRPASRPQ